jgi:hypothetical protein
MAAEDLYHALSEERKEIRLLGITTTPDDDIQCTLSTVSLRDCLQFTALSYVWGDPTDTEPFRVNGRDVLITKSLAFALRHVKDHWQGAFPERPAESFRLWADGLCINQADTAERSHQVQLMGEIYGDAELVISWLGHKNSEILGRSLAALDLLHSLTSHLSKDEFASLRWMEPYPFLYEDDAVESSPDNGGHISNDDGRNSSGDDTGGGSNDTVERYRPTNKLWSSLDALCALAYWERVWIVQEVVLAKSLLLTCPHRSVPFAVVYIFDYLLDYTRKAIINGSVRRPVFIHEDSAAFRFIGATLHWGSISTLSFLRKLVRQWSGERWYIFKAAMRFRAANPRDLVYGLLGVTKAKIIPDYSPSKALSEVLIDYVGAWLQAKHNGRDTSDPSDEELFFLEYTAEVQTNESKDVVSWVPHYHAFEKRRPPCSFWEAKANRDLPDGQASYIRNSTLCVTGMLFGSLAQVVKIPDRSNHAALLQYMQDVMCRQPTYVPLRIPTLTAILLLLVGKGSTLDFNFYLTAHTLFRSMVSDMFSKTDDRTTLEKMGIELDGYPGTLFSSLWPGSIVEEQGVADSRVSFAALMRHYNSASLEMVLYRTLAALEHWANVLDGCALGEIHVQPHIYLALIPATAKVNDSVCILHGSQYPVLLRNAGGHWTFLGTCVVLGLMDGEAASMVNDGWASIRKFEVK